MSRNLIKTLFLIYLLSSFNFSNAQTSIITKYYDSSWIEVPRESAFFVGEFERSDSVYLFTSYWMKSKKIQSRGVFKDTLFQKATRLLHKFYESGQTADSIYLANDGNTIFHYHFYENGKLDFKKFYRTNNNLDSAYHYYTNGNLYVHYLYDSKRVNEIVDAYDENGKKIKDFNYGKDAEFPGGSSAWISFLQNNIRTRVPVKNGARVGTYTVIIRFVVDVNGKIGDIVPETNLGFGMEQEGVRVIKKSPDWIPAVELGKKVNAYKRQPIGFIVLDK